MTDFYIYSEEFNECMDHAVKFIEKVNIRGKEIDAIVYSDLPKIIKPLIFIIEDRNEEIAWYKNNSIIDLGND